MADPDLAASLAVLSIQVWLDTYATAGIRPALAHHALEAFTPERCLAWLTAGDTPMLLAWRDHHLLGYARLDLAATCPVTGVAGAELATLYVQRHAAGQGVGSALLAQAGELAAALTGSQRLWLTVYAGNAAARAFYARRGWREVGETSFVFGSERHANRVLEAPPV